MSETVLENFDSILGTYIGRNCGWDTLCILLDYDGTLAPCASHPDLTVLPHETRVVLEELCQMLSVERY